MSTCVGILILTYETKYFINILMHGRFNYQNNSQNKII